jgi:hypothetical protein
LFAICNKNKHKEKPHITPSVPAHFSLKVQIELDWNWNWESGNMTLEVCIAKEFEPKLKIAKSFD